MVSHRVPLKEVPAASEQVDTQWTMDGKLYRDADANAVDVDSFLLDQLLEEVQLIC